MKAILLKDAVKAIGGVLLNAEHKNIDNIYITDISIDSRKIQKGSLFVPIVGEKFDAHDFISISMENGAVCAFTEKNDSNIIKNNMVIYVDNTIKALGALAKFYISNLDVIVIGITGSVGKTTTKDMIASVTNQRYNTLKTDGNYNNEIGLPLTIFKITEKHKVAVLEMGMSQFGEIDYLSNIAKPDIAVITNIGISHIENLGSRKGILNAKTEIFNHINKNACAILNEDDDMLITLKNKLDFGTYWFGIENKSGIYADNINFMGLEGVNCSIHSNNDIINVSIPSPGKHIIYSAMIATAIGVKLGLSIEQIKRGIETFVPTEMRMVVINAKNGITIINDVYNASPQSMKAALDVLKNSGKHRKVAILGDMFELGNCALNAHNEIGEYAANINIDVIICIGELGKYIYYGAEKYKMSHQSILYFENQENFQNELLDIIKKYDTILVKASRGMYLEKTIDKIKKVEL